MGGLMSRDRKEERLPDVPVQTTESETQTENVGLDLSNDDVEPELPQHNLAASSEEQLQDDSTQLEEPVLSLDEQEPVLSDENRDSEN
jgi:hypothetical protein